MLSGTTNSLKRSSPSKDDVVIAWKDKLFLFQKQMRWLWVHFFKLVMKEDIDTTQFWVVKGRGLQTEQDWYLRLDVINTMIQQFKTLLKKHDSGSIIQQKKREELSSLCRDIERNLLLLRTLLLNRLPSSQRSLEQYFLDTEQQKDKQYKKRRLTKGIRL